MEATSPEVAGVSNLAEGINCLSVFVCDSARKITLDDDVRTGILHEGLRKMAGLGPALDQKFPQLAQQLLALASFARRRPDWKPESLAEAERLATACVIAVMATMWGDAGPKGGKCPIHGPQCPDVLPAARLP
ncbi:MAG: hypothetical protein QM723_33750 [Myxococcaceae bacterium]